MVARVLHGASCEHRCLRWFQKLVEGVAGVAPLARRPSSDAGGRQTQPYFLQKLRLRFSGLQRSGSREDSHKRAMVILSSTTWGSCVLQDGMRTPENQAEQSEGGTLDEAKQMTTTRREEPARSSQAPTEVEIYDGAGDSCKRGSDEQRRVTHNGQDKTHIYY